MISTGVLQVNGMKIEDGCTVKPVLSSHSKEDQKLVFNTNYCLSQVKVLQNA